MDFLSSKIYNRSHRVMSLIIKKIYFIHKVAFISCLYLMGKLSSLCIICQQNSLGQLGFVRIQMQSLVRIRLRGLRVIFMHDGEFSTLNTRSLCTIDHLKYFYQKNVVNKTFIILIIIRTPWYIIYWPGRWHHDSQTGLQHHLYQKIIQWQFSVWKWEISMKKYVYNSLNDTQKENFYSSYFFLFVYNLIF